MPSIARTLRAVALVLVTWGCPSAAPTLDYRDPPQDSDAAASVNGVMISRSTLDDELDRVLPAAASARVRAIERQRLLRQLVERELLTQAAARAGVGVPTTAIEEAFGRWGSRFESRAALRDALRRARKTPQSQRAELLERLELEALLGKLGRTPVVSDADVRARFERDARSLRRPARARVAHVLVRVGPGGPAAARKRIDAARKALARRLPFEEVARRFGEGRVCERGGDLGEVIRGQMAAPFEKLVFSLEPGATGVVQTYQGLHLVKVIAREPAWAPSFAEAEARLRAALWSERLAAARRALVRELEQQATIRIPAS